MLRGDLSRTPLADVLLQLAAGSATGRLDVPGPSSVHLHDGAVYAANVPGARASLAARLLTHGTLAPADLAGVLERAPRTQQELTALLVDRGLVDPHVVDAFLHEQVLWAVGELARQPAGPWSFTPHARTRDDVAPPLGVPTLLAAVTHRSLLWERISDVVGGAHVVPALSPHGVTPDGTSVDADAWALLHRVDGVRSLGELAQECGLTLFEAGRTVHDLVEAGLVDIDDEPVARPAAPGLLPPGLAARLTAALASSDAAGRPADEADADVVDLGQVREQAQRAAEERAQAEEAAAVRAAQQAEAAEQAVADQAVAEQAAAEQAIAEQAAAEQAMAEQAVAQAQEAAERVASELAAHRAAEEQARLQAEEAEQAARLAQEQHALQVAEQERLAAEQARLVADHAARLAAQRAEAARRQQEQEVTAEQAQLLSAELTALDDPPPALQVVDPESAAAAFAELRATASSSGAPGPAQTTAPEPEQTPAPDWQQGWPEPPAPAADTDTASLLRELASLGLDDAAPDQSPRALAAGTPAPRGSAPPPSASAAPPRRKKGLFGR